MLQPVHSQYASQSALGPMWPLWPSCPFTHTYLDLLLSTQEPSHIRQLMLTPTRRCMVGPCYQSQLEAGCLSPLIHPHATTGLQALLGTACEWPGAGNSCCLGCCTANVDVDTKVDR
jgi:hypothetical protein